MKRSPPIQFLAAMSSRSPYRGGRGRGQGRRGFSDRPNNGERGQLVSGDWHLRSVREANLGLRQGERGSFTNQAPYNQNQQYRQSPPYNQNQQYRQSPPYNQNQQYRQSPPYNQNQQYRQSPPYNQNQQYRQSPPYNQNHQFRPPHAFRQPPPFDQNQAVRPQQQQQFRPRRPKPLDYRNWESAKTAPPPNCERFVVLSYNILADYLAIGHRHKLYFHIPHYMLDWEWRKRNILFELGLWSTDIMCFQEVDRFQDLEEELTHRGYSGIWKMRTGMPVDGCAIFWRTSRFKLLHEECIEFNKLGLRDNVAQICVLELLSQNNAENTAALPTSSTGSNKVVICNIHVLYNPKRGEIKLGQIRMLLDRAHSVSKIWNNAPVVLCGDFNCTPKSPLYNFISEQKLDLSGLDRDKLSGQASAEIHAPRPSNPVPGFQLADSSVLTPSLVDGREVGIKLNDSLSDMQKENNPNSNVENPPFMNLSQPQCATTVLDVCNKSDVNMQCGNEDSALYDEVTRETKQTLEDGSKGETISVFTDTIDSSKESSSAFRNEDVFPVDQINDELQIFTTPVASHLEDIYSSSSETEHGEKANATSHSNQVSLSEHSDFHIYTENESTNYDNSSLSHEVSPPEGSGYLSSQSIASDEKGSPPTPYEVNVSSESTSIDLDKKLESLSLNEVAMAEGETVGEDDSAFLSPSHGTEDAFPADFGEVMRSDLDHSPKEFAFDPHNPLLHSPSDEVLDDFSAGLDSEAVDVEKTTYDPSLWTPMEIATATGNADCTFLEHPLKLKSTYTEVEDCSGTRDSSEEPLVTSYNRCFLGTVDYIWRSEGLQTVRVLAPIPKQAMQWTPGFPTKKWGSDHIALASELVFTKDLSNHNTEVR